MSFLYPSFLFALLAIAIPVIIHLFNFRRYKKVYFTNVRFLKELKQESDSKSRLRELLILACRILAIAFLVLAFAQPFIPGKQAVSHEGEKAISIYIDNSFSMESVNKHGSLLENAKNRAAEIVQAFSPSDRFQLLTNDFEGRHQRFLSRDEILEQINDVKISPAVRNLDEVIRRQADLLNQGSSKIKRSFLLSDFQKNSFTLNKGSDTSLAISLIPLEASEVNNVYIDTCWFETPVQQEGLQQKLHARIINNSSRELENASVKLFINNNQVSLASFNCAAQSRADVVIDYKIRDNGINFCSLKLEDYPVTFDDEFYFSYTSQKHIPCLVISGKESRTAPYWRTLMQNDSLFAFYENAEQAIDYGLFSKCNLIVLNELSAYSSGLVTELQKFVMNGGTAWIIPATKSDLVSYNTCFRSLQLPEINALDTNQTRASAISFEQGLYEGVFDKQDRQMDLPKVLRHYSMKLQSRSNSKTIVSLQNGEPWLTLTDLDKGKLYLLSSPVDEQAGNFLKHALFVPTVIKIAISSIKPQPLYYHTAANEAIPLPSVVAEKDKPFHIERLDKTFDVIPSSRVVNTVLTLFTQNQVNIAGQYHVVYDKQNLAGISFNYDRRESAMEFYNTEALEAKIAESGLKHVNVIDAGEKSLTNSVQEINDGKKLWKLCLILALAFLACEALIIRLFRN
ncbi:MAG: BatA and WFA domain-containing protein [Bacteroidetes bacterium]|nr:BatA and WFA domain-containing protein [Bacteroidota bacterium]